MNPKRPVFLEKLDPNDKRLNLYFSMSNIPLVHGYGFAYYTYLEILS